MRKAATGRRKIGYIFLTALAFVLLAEAMTRLTRGPRWVNPHYVRVSSDFADLDALIEDIQDSAGPSYYDEFLYAAGAYSSEHLNVTSYYSARLTPDSSPLTEAEEIVWTFGGSTMANRETTDDLTIANTWARIFNESLAPTHVKNFGTGGFFSSYELIKFQKLLREVPETEFPTIAIFYDGYNDAQYGFQYGPGNLQKDLSLKVKALVEHENFRIGAYVLSRTFSEYSRLWERTAARVLDSLLFPLPQPNAGDAVLDATTRIYLSNVRMIQATCAAFVVRCLFILQPLILTKEPLSEVEQTVLDNLEAHPRFGPEGIRFMREFYERVSEELADDPGFVDASDVLDGRAQADFYDPGHVGAQTPPVIGEKTARLILTRLEGR